MLSVTNRPNAKPNRLPLILGIALLCIFSAYFVLHARAARPSLFAHASSAATRFQWSDGNWYWLEGEGTLGSHLVRANAATHTVAAASRIGSYAVGAGKAAWTSQNGKQWSVTLAAADGSGPQTLWSGDSEPQGVSIADGQVFWLAPAPSSIAGSEPFPPFSGTLQLFSAPLAGSPFVPIATLLETTAQQVIGVHEGQVYVAALREGIPGVTVFYRIDLKEKSVHRLAAETGRQTALLTGEGDFYWSAPSRESTERDKVVCIRRLSKAAKPEMVTDWLPEGGRMYETRQGIYYVDGGYIPSAWPLPGREELPQPTPLPENFSVLAVGQGELLLNATGSPTPDLSIYRMALP